MQMFKEKTSANVDKEQIELFLEGGWFKTEKEALDACAVKPKIEKATAEEPKKEVEDDSSKEVKKIIKKVSK